MLKKAIWRILEAGSAGWMNRYVPALRDNGWFRSRREDRCVDGAGEPLPWLAYPAIDFLKRRVSLSLSVFEYGSGASTLWWARRVRSVSSVEHEASWAGKVAAQAPKNVEVAHVPLDGTGAYARQILAQGKPFDIVVIDGAERVACVAPAMSSLTAAGVIVFDNSERPEYEEGYRQLGAGGFRRLEFVGMAPLIDYEIETSIFYRTGNCLGL
jgi:hypothetical protein